MVLPVYSVEYSSAYTCEETTWARERTKERIPELTSVPTSQSEKKIIIHRHQIRADRRVLSQ